MTLIIDEEQVFMRDISFYLERQDLQLIQQDL